jgi:hypothetical protein
MSFKKLAIFVASFGIMGQTTPSNPDDGYMNTTVCHNIANYCVQNYADAGYGSASECFDDRTGGNCPPPDATHIDIDHVWYYYTGPIQYCYGHC